MDKFLLNSLLLLLLGLGVTPAFAQVRKVTICNPTSRAQEAYIDVYEYDYVDIQPKFPECFSVDQRYYQN